MLKIYLIFTLIAAGTNFILFAADKILAKAQKRRIPEDVLLILTSLGGSVGALAAIYLLHHKSNFKNKFHFYISAWTAFASQAVVLAFLLKA